MVGATFSTGFEESWMISNKSGSVIVYTSSRVICVQYQSGYSMKFYQSTSICENTFDCFEYGKTETISVHVVLQ